MNEIEELKAENKRLKAEITELEEKFLILNGKSFSHYIILQRLKEYLEDIDYIAQFDGTPYDLSVEIKQIITKGKILE